MYIEKDFLFDILTINNGNINKQIVNKLKTKYHPDINKNGEDMFKLLIKYINKEISYQEINNYYLEQHKENGKLFDKTINTENIISKVKNTKKLININNLYNVTNIIFGIILLMLVYYDFLLLSTILFLIYLNIFKMNVFNYIYITSFIIFISYKL